MFHVWKAEAARPPVLGLDTPAHWESVVDDAYCCAYNEEKRVRGCSTGIAWSHDLLHWDWPGKAHEWGVK